MGADEAAVGLERAEIERQVGHGGRENSARGAARQIALEGVARQHAAAEFLDQLACGNAGGGELHARLAHAAGYREAAQALASAPPLRGEPARAFLQGVARPLERPAVLPEGGPAGPAD